ncbi:hypothetical protein D3C71_1608700 [compost metagenome]
MLEFVPVILPTVISGCGFTRVSESVTNSTLPLKFIVESGAFDENFTKYIISNPVFTTLSDGFVITTCGTPTITTSNPLSFAHCWCLESGP